jgi:hypothetical protein
MDAERSSKTLEHFYQITTRHIPEISSLAIIRTAFPDGKTVTFGCDRLVNTTEFNLFRFIYL